MTGGAGVRSARYLPAMCVASGWLLLSVLLPPVAKDDTPAKVDHDGLVRVVVFTESLVRALGDAPVALPRSATP